ncbi:MULTISPECIES: hypothetical protein [unclassified Kitasatospora]|uniref:hypothetical protein n=1 Tax=unclassified Kitasatospora TaxID=2633591 RepID=UPI000AFA820D|nr:hypothetical protein [Kitasatospora sp. MY 5-36]
MDDLLNRLPAIPDLRDRCRALATLDAILSPDDWEARYHSFDASWDEGEELASMRDGEGDDWCLVFSPVGAYGRGFDHEAPNAPELLAAVPEEFRRFAEEPAFGDEDGPTVTRCFWRAHEDGAWRGAAAERGAEGLFDLLLDGSAAGYRAWATEYFEPEHELDLAAIEHVLALRPLTPAVLAALNPDIDEEELAVDLAEIGYPTS